MKPTLHAVFAHPDHIAVSRYTTQAFDLAGSSTDFPEAGLPWQPKRLFYNAIPPSFFVEMRRQMQALGMDTSQFDGFDLRRHGLSDDQITTRIDVAQFADAQWNALRCHGTQFGEDNLLHRLPEEELRQMMAREYFAQARPDATNGSQKSDESLLDL